MVLSARQKSYLDELVPSPYAFFLGEYVDDLLSRTLVYSVPKMTADSTSAISTTAVDDGTTNGVMDSMAQPDIPRKLQFNYSDTDADGDAAGTWTFNLTGLDINGSALSETVIMTVASGAGTLYSSYAYSRLTTVTVVGSIASGTSTASDQVQIGHLNEIGLPFKINSSADILKGAINGADSEISSIRASYDATANTVLMDGNGNSLMVFANPTRWEWTAG